VARAELSIAEWVEGVRERDRAILGRAITLLESRRPEHRDTAHALLTALMPHTGGSHRIGISGIPGAGKSTFIEAFGTKLIAEGHRVAVLAIDPSSTITGGSILGDKTRMQRLANDPNAFVRPSPSSGQLGGVARRTQETVLLCEAAGFDVVIVETIGVGQSETTLAEMVDFFLLLVLPGGGDELQGIKRGILELADLVAINKADGDRIPNARAAQAEYSAAFRLLRKDAPAIVLTSALEGTGLSEVWAAIERKRAEGDLEQRRAEQRIAWMHRLIREELVDTVSHHPAVKQIIAELEQQVQAGSLSPSSAAMRALDAFFAAILADRR
jgi:LAO/AO transport system kinase